MICVGWLHLHVLAPQRKTSYTQRLADMRMCDCFRKRNGQAPIVSFTKCCLQQICHQHQ